ncbi:hypothetical protein MUN76_12825 [Leucobacter rhizosphaerae]|uniref:Bacterial bifunctional deaminase-reductase C-terminal domain-containing protein n=1 Tax=Leucobacter rhizosphaerae TaxID=2932245 RepID=A0ABY4FUD4_9MICO|nr:hypothetical protein [Leucobacter rhizosphaerae]UOQ59916.1 hypothetical protein MUN76_12825 [Leucobacter rhizosphaerae]
MDAVAVAILSESERVGDLSSVLVIGELSEEALQALPGTTTVRTADDLLREDPSAAGHHDLVVCAGALVEGDLRRRALGHALAAVAGTAVISVQPLGDELPIPLIELKRGLLLDAPELGYRVYGQWKERS